MPMVLRRVICGRCRRTYRSTEWLGLELVDVLDIHCIRKILSDWPADHLIEVRHCKGCGAEIAREARFRNAAESA
jgi:hypothetical protein